MAQDSKASLPSQACTLPAADAATPSGASPGASPIASPPAPLDAPRGPSALRALGAYRKLTRPRLKVVVITDGYHVQRECCRALRALGHEVAEFPAEAPAAAEHGGAKAARGTEGPNGPQKRPVDASTEEPPAARMARLARLVAAFRPDMLLSINYVGFDRLGMLGELIETLRLPLALWFVDSPLFFAMGYLPPTAHMTTTFVWDRSHAAFLRSLGAPRVVHLPLGCEPAAFGPTATPEPGTPAGAPPFPACFVGASLLPLGEMWQARLDNAEQQQARDMAARLQADRAALHKLVPAPAPPIDRRVMMAAWANCLASRAYRTALLTHLSPRELHIFGDARWSELLPKAQLHGPVAYGQALAGVYRRSRININATILQMPTAVNQRLFDVPAAGGFLLTDDQAEVHELFCADKGEVVVYRDGDGLAALYARYSRDDAGRRQVVARARARIEAEHTYVHRLQTLLAQMRRDHGAAKFGPSKFAKKAPDAAAAGADAGPCVGPGAKPSNALF